MAAGITYRMAKETECTSLAEMINLASGGVVEFLFRDMVPEMTPVQIIARNLARAGPAHSYQNTHVAIVQDRVVGMALAFSADHHYIGAEMRKFFPEDRLAHLEDFYNARVDGSLMLDALCVAEDFRRKGIGSNLIEQVKERAAVSGYGSISLLAFADNATAIRVYRQQGFNEVRAVTLDPHELIPHDGGCLLMKCDV